MNMQDLMTRRAQAWDAAKKFLDEKADAKGMLTAEDAAQYDRMEKDVSDYTAQIERMKRAEEIENELKKPVRNELRSPIGGEKTGKTGCASDEYREAFWKVMRAGNAAMTPEIRNALQVGTDTEGGYTVPEEFERTLIQTLDENNMFRRYAHKITTSGDRKISTLATHATAHWTEEEAAYTESDVSFGQKTLSAYKMTTHMKISEELLADSAFNMSSFIAGEFGRDMGKLEEEAFFSGEGTTKPTGILATGAAELGVTAAAATAITLDEVIDLYYSLRAPYRAKAIFVVNDDTVKALRKLKDKEGQYLWQPAVTAGAPDTILGRTLETSEFMPKAESGKSAILFADLSYYWIADRGAYSFKRLNELYAANGQVGFIAHKRVDGMLMLNEAAKYLKMGT